MGTFDTVATEEAIKKTVEALAGNNITAMVVENAVAAKEAVLGMLPKGAEVLTMTSRTLEVLGLVEAINDSGDYDAVRPKLNAMWGDPTKKREQRKLGAAPDFAIGSVHALTQDGHALIASNTGSQLPAYVYGAGTVIWVVGAQKIVKDLVEAEQRLQEYVFPLENERSKKAYGSPSNISKLLHFNKEVAPDRVKVVIVKEALGF